ncbi:cytochrome P450 [Micromonospora sp. PLK6-60]|uniref:cytochrome P450 n=1 Tax=Micromonospora sp. PLK6-60 TaxID=2873383 RepID=UPI001CA688D6|nr:cytochrome P450 [Micromonospora sp. PLK6-60]MBY8874923.1 cytochrome P450 [Micromonospora sp. PLK6-60]
MTVAPLTDLPRWPPLNLDRDPLVPLDAGERRRFGGPVTRVRLPTDAVAWLVTRHADVRQLLRHPAFSADLSRPGFPLLRRVAPGALSDRRGGFIRMDGAEHARLRRMLTAEFMIKNVRRIEPLIRQSVERALAELAAAGPPADLVTRFALPVPSMVICHLLGVPYADHDFFQQRSRTLIDRDAPPERVQRHVRELREFLHRLVERKVAAGERTDDLLSRLARDRVDTGELAADELVGMAVLLLIAGHETTANMIGLSTLLLLRHPARYAALRHDPEHADGLVDELLRYLSIVRTGLPRLATADVEIGGQLIRAGEGAIAVLSLANRDADVFADPHGFDPYRAAQQHLAFGFGVHQCIGQPLARAELRIALVELARRFPRLRAASTGSLPTRDSSIVYGLDSLPVTW